MTATYQVKGSTLRSKLDYAEHAFGCEARSAVEALLKRRGAFPLLTAAWYPYDLYVEVLELIARDHLGGDRRRLVEVGAASAQAALSSVYQAFVCPGGFLEFLEGISKLHHLFYDQGRLDVRVHPDRRGCDILHRGKPLYAEADLHVAAGFYTRAAELHGLNPNRCTFEHSEDGVDFCLTWPSSQQ